MKTILIIMSFIPDLFYWLIKVFSKKSGCPSCGNQNYFVGNYINYAGAFECSCDVCGHKWAG